MGLKSFMQTEKVVYVNNPSKTRRSFSLALKIRPCSVMNMFGKKVLTRKGKECDAFVALFLA